jgi:hypothetical protein
MTENVEAMIRQAIRAAKAGQKDEARQLLLRVTEIDETNEKAWIWLSGVVETDEDRMTCLENVLIINPGNQDAQRGLRMLEAKQAKSQSEVSPFAGVTEDDWGDIDADTSGFMADLDMGIPDEEPPAEDEDLIETDTGSFATVEPDYQTGYETAFNDDVFGDFDTPFDDEPEPEPEPAPPMDIGFDDDLEEADDLPYADEPAGIYEDYAEEDEAYDAGGYDAGLYFDEDEDDTIGGDEAGNEIDLYFADIPEGIRATRPPGVDERYSPLLIPVLVLLVIGNLGAVGWLVLNLVG